jgi:hypothetical protein
MFPSPKKQIVKKNVIENIVPIIIHLKHLLEEKHSPLLGPLMQYLTDMMKDYKNEISGTASASFFLPSPARPVVVVGSRTHSRALSVPHLRHHDRRQAAGQGARLRSPPVQHREDAQEADVAHGLLSRRCPTRLGRAGRLTHGPPRRRFAHEVRTYHVTFVCGSLLVVQL